MFDHVMSLRTYIEHRTLVSPYSENWKVLKMETWNWLLRNMLSFLSKLAVLCGLDCHEGTSGAKDSIHYTPVLTWWKVCSHPLFSECKMNRHITPFHSIQSCWSLLRICTSWWQHKGNASLYWCSYEDWGVDELIVEDSWRRQVGGWCSIVFLSLSDMASKWTPCGMLQFKDWWRTSCLEIFKRHRRCT